MIDIDVARRILAQMSPRPFIYEEDRDFWELYADIGPCKHGLEIIRAPKNNQRFNAYWPKDTDAMGICYFINQADQMLDELDKHKDTIQQLQTALVEERAIAMYKAAPQRIHDHLHKLPNFLQEDWRRKAMRELAKEFPGLRWDA